MIRGRTRKVGVFPQGRGAWVMTMTGFNAFHPACWLFTFRAGTELHPGPCT
jgi:hypothetical protein